VPKRRNGHLQKTASPPLAEGVFVPQLLDRCLHLYELHP
jgi:hypothetical protein